MEPLLTWAQRRELDREAWIASRLDVLARLRLDDLTDPDVVRAIATHATELGELAGRLAALRGDDRVVEVEVAAATSAL